MRTLEGSVSMLVRCKELYDSWGHDGPLSIYGRFITKIAENLDGMPPAFDIRVMRELSCGKIRCDSEGANEVFLRYLGLLVFYVLEERRPEYLPALKEIIEFFSKEYEGFNSINSFDDDNILPLACLIWLKKIQEKFPDFVSEINSNEKIKNLHKKTIKSGDKIGGDIFLSMLDILASRFSPNKKSPINRLEDALRFIKDQDAPELTMPNTTQLSHIHTLTKFYMDTTNEIAGCEMEKIGFDELMLPFFIDAMRDMTQEQIVNTLADYCQTGIEKDRHHLYHFDKMIMVMIFASPMHPSQWMQLTELILQLDLLT